MTATPITSFTGEHAFLSNFHPSPITVGGLAYPTVEHAFQACKTVDPKRRAGVAAAPTPGTAKRMGRRLDLRPDWNTGGSLRAMWTALDRKFAPGTALAAQLLATGDAELIEGNRWNDRYWGACFDNGEWVGDNHLGRLLQQIRTDLAGAA